MAYDLATGERLPGRDIVLADRGGDVRGIWSDGDVMWVLDGERGALFAYDLATGQLLGGYALDPANGDPRGLWSDGVSIWVSDPGAGLLFAYRRPAPHGEAGNQSRRPLERVPHEEFAELAEAGNDDPSGIWSDGDVMFVADGGQGRVYSYNMPDAINARLGSLSLEGIDIGGFAAGRTEYVGFIAEGVAETTVTAQAVQPGADVAVGPQDADGAAANGHQVILQGVSEITITVTSADGTRQKFYRVRLKDPGRKVALKSGWNLLAWPGADGASLVEMMDDEGVADNLVAVYRWDEAAAAWLGYHPGPEGIPGINSLTTLSNGQNYWVGVKNSATWKIPGSAGV